MGARKKVRLFGRMLRLGLGIFFVTEVWPVYAAVDSEGVLIRVGWAIALIVIYIALHFIVSRFARTLNPVLGAFIAFVPLLAMFFLGYGDPAATGALTYLAFSLILAGLRADPGCEVMSVPAFFLGNHTHLACLLFSPIDWMERKMS